jgi:selenocysteine-specific elongation factor
VKRLVVGTAGHIDHGKTRLVEALTGIDCDRWAEEKARGITIDLGFAHLERGDVQLSFVDVPGHERFLHNALAGLGGIRALLLVVAADEGVKPQTREHLAIATLLGIPAAVVALTKVDLVGRELAELAQLEVEELLASTPYAAAPIVAVSSETGQGIAELERRLLGLAVERAPAAGEPARLPIDRAFHVKGLGVVVTGTLVSGTVAPGDVLELLPAGSAVKVRGVQVHGRARQQAAGERSALQISGVELAQVERGMTLATPGACLASTSLACEFTLLADAPRALRGSLPVRLHLYSAEVSGRLRPLGVEELRPGERGPVELRLQAPVAAARGDRFVVRRPSPAATLGGGRVLDPAWRRRRGRALGEALAALGAGEEEALTAWVEEEGERGLAAEDAARRLGVSPPRATAALQTLAGAGRLLAVPATPARPPRWLAPAAYRRVAERARQALDEHFRRDRLARGMPKAEAVRRALAGPAGELADVYLEWLQAAGVLTLRGDLVDLPGRRPELDGEESRLARDLLARFAGAGLHPPGPGELQAELGAKPQILAGVMRYLQERGELVRLPSGLVIAASAIADLRQRLLQSGWERFTVPQFKERFGLTRKWAIPLLEHLDSTGATRRLGDERQVVRPR